MADADTSAVASSPVSGLETGMATLSFKAINEPRSPERGLEQAGDHSESSGNAEGVRSKENRRRTASLERYR